jgi:uncharacterized protein YdeI (YjbR/CyaY-like superfamily)
VEGEPPPLPTGDDLLPALRSKPLVLLETATELRDWLAANHATSSGIWLLQWRAPTGRPSIPYDDLVEEVLCWGWIDSTVRTVDDWRRALMLTPRKPRSVWSAPNKERLARLEAAGRMQPTGRAVVERAKADGSWTTIDEAEAMIEPDDLVAALAAVPGARAAWDGFTRGRRKVALQWIAQARRPETRAKRIGETARLASEGRPPIG